MRVAVLLLILFLLPASASAQLFAPRRDEIRRGPLLDLQVRLGRSFAPRYEPRYFSPPRPRYFDEGFALPPRLLLRPRVSFDLVIVPGSYYGSAYSPQFPYSGPFGGGGYYP